MPILLFLVSFVLLLAGVAIHVHGFMPGRRRLEGMAQAIGGLILAMVGFIGILVSTGWL